jgi:hypothetical protein
MEGTAAHPCCLKNGRGNISLTNQGVQHAYVRLRTILSTKIVQKRTRPAVQKPSLTLPKISAPKFHRKKSRTYLEERSFRTNLSTETVGKSLPPTMMILQCGNLSRMAAKFLRMEKYPLRIKDLAWR